MKDRNEIKVVTTILAGLLALAPAVARGEGLLLDRALSLDHVRPVDLRVALGDAKPGTKSDSKSDPANPDSKSSPSLDFDLLGDAPKPAAPAEDPSLKKRRQMLNLHQGLGLGLLGLQVASTVTGQLNYNDKFGVDNTGKWKATHKVVTYTNIAAFAVVGGIALFAPTEKNAPKRPFGRTSIHKIGMALATVGMATQAYLGVKTVSREGFIDQQDYAKKHLVVGYATLAVMGIAVGALVF